MGSSWSIYQLYNSQAGATAAASFDVRGNGIIKQIQWCAQVAGAVDGGSQAWLSWLNSNVFSNNDQLGIISGIRSYTDLETSGLAVKEINFIVPCNVVVSAADRLYLWAAGGTGQTITVNCFLHIDDGLEDQSVTRRRR